MVVPAVLATVAACGSIVTSIKSSWELRRMIKRKAEAKESDEEAPYIFRRLRRAYYDGLMGTQEYEQWYEKFLVAKVEKDLSGMRRIRAHLRILENGAPLTTDHRSRDCDQSRRHSRHSVSCGGGLDWRKGGGNLEYHPDRQERVGARPDQFIRLDQQATYSNSRSSSSSNTSRSQSSSDRYKPRGRPERRYDSYESGDSSDYSSERRRPRGRSLNR
ncbi:hypothetical protein BT67DRAFT_443444 [Trichocladium antarcticum]|uniref:Uncharacterized protein n=1 Tax=Trichocladium antarcticum TaxID=1450529 RepID=A0AAN6UGU1_9PEZI|nr:hypothetical protein BT67DRAFT_443444 [Trichocladium antarcticum]